MGVSNVFTNTFEGGLIQTIDPHLQSNNSFRFSIGGRIQYNRTNKTTQSLDDNIKDGRSRSFSNALGNSFSFSICEGYKVLGSIETTKGVILFSTNEINSEIGFLTVNDNIYKTGYAQYQTLYNDRLDPNGDLLHFDINHYIHGYNVYENELTERQYFVDDYNQKRVTNLPLFYKPDGTTYHDQSNACTSTATYPKWMSVHSFDARMDVKLPVIKFNRRIKGTCKSGQYRITGRYVSKTGHKSVCFPLIEPVFVTDQRIDGEVNGIANAYQTNHHNRTMGASNIMTEEGLQFIFDGVDTRWDQLEVIYAYYVSNVAFQEANVFKTVDITDPILTVDLNSHTGISIPKDELNQRFETILKVGTTAQQENRSWDGNLETIPEIKLDLSDVKIEPATRFYSPDKTREPLFNAVPNPVSGRDDNDPITNSDVVTKQITIQNFTGSSRYYNIYQDYESYKGQLFTHLFKGYFRGETYPFGILLIDRKGNPLFVQALGDFTFPNQFDTEDKDGNPTDWTLSKQNPNGSFDLRILGAKISNIKIPHDVMFDKFGKLNVSGFMIVRTKRIGRIANQGIMFNAVYNVNNNTNTETDGIIHPQNHYPNYYQLKTAGGYPNAHEYNGIEGSSYIKEEDPNAKAPSYTAAGFFNYHSPDLCIERMIGNATNTNEQMLAGQMQKVGFVHKTYSEAVNIFSNHYYSKLLKTLPLDWQLERDRVKNDRAKLGSKSRIKFAILHDKPLTWTYEKFDPETADIFDYKPYVQSFFPDEKYAWKATQQPYSAIMKLLDWKLIDSIDGTMSTTTYPIVNWLVTNKDYYSGDESTADNAAFDSRRYFSTGHLQPISEELLATVEKTYKDNGQIDNYVFSDIEIFGGDCYNSLYDFTRLYPYYLNCKESDNKYPDYSNSVIVPLESKYNLSLLFGRRFAANAVMPQRTSCTGEKEQLSNGIMPKQPEDFNFNSSLLLEENTQFFFGKPKDIKIIQHQPNGIRWSPAKVYGELQDSYRQNLVNDFAAADGQFGAIQRLIPGFSSLYLLQETGFGATLTKAERIIPTDAGDLQIGSGAVFSGVNYISKSLGTQHPNSVWSFDNAIGWVDARMGKIVVFSQAGLDKTSESDNIDDVITEQTIYYDQEVSHTALNFKDIIGAYDKENSEAITTFLYDTPDVPVENINNRENEMKSFTIVYNKNDGRYHGFQHFLPKIYFNAGRYLFAPDPQEEHNQFVFNHGKYGYWFSEYYPTVLEFVVAPQSNVSKVFDNSYINVDKSAYGRLSEIIATCEGNRHILQLAQTSVSSVINNEELAEYMESSLRVILHEEDDMMLKERLRGHYLVIRLTIDNSQQNLDGLNTQVSISNIDTVFRTSSPIQY